MKLVHNKYLGYMLSHDSVIPMTAVERTFAIPLETTLLFSVTSVLYLFLYDKRSCLT